MRYTSTYKHNRPTEPGEAPTGPPMRCRRALVRDQATGEVMVQGYFSDPRTYERKGWAKLCDGDVVIGEQGDRELYAMAGETYPGGGDTGA